MSTKEEKKILEIAIARGSKAVRHLKSGKTTISTGQSAKGRNTSKLLAHSDGTLTRAGLYYFDRTGEKVPDKRNGDFDRNQQPVQVGNS